ncbi:MAG: hypothetical protein GY913_12700 [Proteobacteria bacterium]|nr:hypothetical protein [Pseudomonadota bacterium]MCP4917765.1 hypothetical protein [Pseudomonadota bacterium]
MLLALIQVTLAQDITVDIDQDKADAAGIDPTEFENELAATIESELRLGDQSAYLEQMARAALLSSKGMGVDYATNPQKFVIGGSVGSAVNASGARFGKGGDTLPTGGFAFQASGIAGLNLGAFAEEDSFARRFLVYGNGMVLETNGEPFAGDLLNYGGHIQFKIIKSRNEAMAEWGGLDLTAGYEYSAYTLSATKGLPIESSGTTWDATGTYTITSTTWSVPVELSTNIRVAFWTLFGGVAYDAYQNGSASSTIGLDGDITTKVQGQSMRLGSAGVTYGESAALPEFGLPRAFVGTQINIFPVKIYGHMNMALDEGFGGHAGVRVAL